MSTLPTMGWGRRPMRHTGTGPPTKPPSKALRRGAHLDAAVDGAEALAPDAGGAAPAGAVLQLGPGLGLKLLHQERLQQLHINGGGRPEARRALQGPHVAGMGGVPAPAEAGSAGEGSGGSEGGGGAKTPKQRRRRRNIPLTASVSEACQHPPHRCRLTR